MRYADVVTLLTLLDITQSYSPVSRGVDVIITNVLVTPVADVLVVVIL